MTLLRLFLQAAALGFLGLLCSKVSNNLFDDLVVHGVLYFLDSIIVQFETPELELWGTFDGIGVLCMKL